VPSEEQSFYIIVLNWNGWEDTRACLESLRKTTFGNKRIVVVDNGSQDRSADRIAEHFPEVILLRSESNLGFTGGNNLGLQHALAQGAEYIMLLNNDTVVDPAFIEPLVEALNNHYGAVSPVVYYESKPAEPWFAGSRINWKTGWAYHESAAAGQDGIAQTDYVSGCALTARAITWKRIGLLDDDFFLCYEDADWSVRAARQGEKLGVVTRSRIWHKVAIATAKQGKPFGTFVFVRNGLLFIRKHVRSGKLSVYLRFIAQWVFWPCLRELKSGVFSCSMARARIAGVLAHMSGRYGDPFAATRGKR
jgi:GT2 family glycosyltransferase